MKILITGSTGLVGSEAIQFFTDKNWNVVGIDNNMRSQFYGTPDKTPSLQMDIRDEEAINTLFAEHKFDAIIHAAAQPSHDFATDHVLLDFDINARGTLVLLEATRKHCPEAVFVYVSSDKVYGGHMYPHNLVEMPTRYHSKYPFNENLGFDETSRSLFGCSKTAADLYVQEYGRYFGMKTACFRPGCITGRNHEGAEQHGFMAYLVKCIKEEKPYRIFGFKGKQVRDQIHAYDLVNAFYHFIKKPRCGVVYNIGGGQKRALSILDAIEWVEEETGKKAIYEILPEPRRSDRIWDVHDVSKFKNDYPDWDYKYDLPEIIKDLCRTA